MGVFMNFLTAVNVTVCYPMIKIYYLIIVLIVEKRLINNRLRRGFYEK